MDNHPGPQDPQAVAPYSREIRRESYDEAASKAEEDHIRVICRVRPPKASLNASRSGVEGSTCVTVEPDGKTVVLKTAGGPKAFTFDHAVGPDAEQETLFQLAGKAATRACMQGFNGTIFCYGQTGSGKTYTMFGPDADMCDRSDERRGLVPRVLEYLFSCIAREEQRNGGSVRHLCRCSFFEIFNERVFDLLDAGCSVGGLQVREDMKKGVYVEGLTEEPVDSPRQAHQMLTRGQRNRHVGETAMNRESSRSHAVFSVVVESRHVDPDVDGITRSRCASFNLVDLAGSERQSATGATGDRLREAGSINKSLSVLGNVINALVEVAAGKSRYVPYRDSRLTFLLRDSIGGNAKTFLVAAIAPGDDCFAETLSTLKFAQRVKMIKNKAVVNENTTGTVEALQRQLRQLRQELLAARAIIDASSRGPRTTTTHLQQHPVLSEENTHDESVDPEEVARLTHGLERQHCVESLLKEALERSSRMEKARESAEQHVLRVQEVVDRLEEKLLQETLVRKMRDNRIQRLLSSNPPDREAGAEVDMLRAELELVRKELERPNPDVLKWRAEAEQAQMQLAALTDAKGLGMWVLSKEQGYRLQLQDELASALGAKAGLEAHVVELQEQLESRAASRRLSQGSMERMKETEQRVVFLEEELSSATRLASDAEAKLADSRAQVAEAVSAQSQLEVKVALLERKVQALCDEKEALQRAQSREVATLQDKIVVLQALQHQQQKENAHSEGSEERLAAVCKDNTILLQRLRDTAQEASEALSKLDATRTEVKDLQEASRAWNEERDALQADLTNTKESQRHARELCDQQSRQLVELRSSIEILNAEAVTAQRSYESEITRVRNELVESQTSSQSLRSENEELTFQLASLQEDHDTLRELLEFTSSKYSHLNGALNEAKEALQDAETKMLKRDQAILVLKSQNQVLEAELDKVGGGAAEDKRRIREAEEAKCELSEERDRLLTSLEAARGEVHELAEQLLSTRQEASEHRRVQTQVIEQLKEQVAGLRMQLCEAERFREEAVTLEQERQSLLARIVEAEEATTGLGEEVKAYLSEIESLQARLHGQEQAHQVAVEALQDAAGASAAAFKEEIQQLTAQVTAKQQSIEQLELRVSELRSREDDLLVTLEEARGAQEDGQQVLQGMTRKQHEMLQQLEDARQQVKHLEKEKLEAEWRHAEQLADVRRALADAERRASDAFSLRASLASAEARSQELNSRVEGLESELQEARVRCDALAMQVAQLKAVEQDGNEWRRERSMLEAELVRCCEMEKDAFEKWEFAEKQMAKAKSDVEALEQEVGVLKAANAKLSGHANSRQKIQMHNKMKEELAELRKQVKLLEEENFRLSHGVHKAGKVLRSTASKGEPLANVTNLL